MLLAQLMMEKLTGESAHRQQVLRCILQSTRLPETVAAHPPGVQPFWQGISSTDLQAAHHLHHDFGFINKLIL